MPTTYIHFSFNRSPEVHEEVVYGERETSGGRNLKWHDNTGSTTILCFPILFKVR